MTVQIPYEIECPICSNPMKQKKETYGYSYYCRPNKKHSCFAVTIVISTYPKVLKAHD